MKFNIDNFLIFMGVIGAVAILAAVFIGATWLYTKLMAPGWAVIAAFFTVLVLMAIAAGFDPR